MGRMVWLFGPPLLQAVLIFVLSHQPALPAPPGGDKLAHLVVYGLLSLLLMRGLYYGTRWRVGVALLVSAVVSSLYGVTDELHQSMIPGRHASVADVLADTAGSVLGALFFWGLVLVLGRFTTRVLRDTRA